MSIIRFAAEFEYVETPRAGSPVYVYQRGLGCQYLIARWNQAEPYPESPMDWDGEVAVPARAMTEVICRVLARADYADIDSVRDALEAYHRDWMNGL